MEAPVGRAPLLLDPLQEPVLCLRHRVQPSAVLATCLRPTQSFSESPFLGLCLPRSF